MTDPGILVRFDRVDGVQTTARGLVADLHGEQLRVEVVREDVVRLKISRGGVFEESPTHAVCVDPFAGVVEFTVSDEGEVVRLRTNAVVVSLRRWPFRLDIHRVDGSPVIESARDEHGHYHTFATLNDAFEVRRTCQPDDPIFGLGEKTGEHNRRGRDFVLWNTDVLDPRASGEFAGTHAGDDPRADNTSTMFDPYYMSIPFFYHQAGPGGAMAASFVDNGYRGTYEFSQSNQYRIAFAGGQYTEYVFAGPNMADILSAYTWLTGRISLPPMWALGYQQCRWHGYSQADVEALARRHRAEQIPCDGLWLDIDYMDGYRVFTWDQQRFPDAQGMLARLREQGFRVITIIDPGIKYDPGYWVYDQAVERDTLCRTEAGGIYLGQVWPGLTAFPDFATEQARTWWGELNAAHVSSGLAGIWNDMNEPATGVVDSHPMRFDHGRASHERYHNQYALLMAMGTVAGLQAAMPDLRTFVLSRAGFAGIQRYAANWLGDNMARWDHLALAIPMANGLGLSGQPFVGADIGGFMGDTNPELLDRWMQYATLTPFCRNHSATGSVDQYAWSFGPQVTDHVRTAIQLRYRLLPYLYSAFVTAAHTGLPVQRPLVLAHQGDADAAAVDDQFLLGADLLVSPVLAPATTERSVYLPAGEWYDWHTEEHLTGPGRIIAAAPAERIPIHVRAGAVVPMWPDAPPSTANHHPEVLELHAFLPVGDGTVSSVLHEDDGLTTAALHGAAVRTDFEVTRTGSKVRITATASGQGFPEFARRAFHLFLHGGPAHEAWVDGVGTPLAGGFLRIPNSGQGFEVDLHV